MADIPVISFQGWDTNHPYSCIISGDGENDQGVKLAAASMGTAFEDMYDAPVTTIYNSTAFQVGATYGGMREQMYNFTLAFHIKSTPDAEWRINESRFRKALSYKADSQIRVKVGSISLRWLNVRLFGSPKLKVITEPNAQRYGLLLVNFASAVPRWVEADVTSIYTTTTDTTLGGTEIGSVTVSNPTDYQIWLKWVTQGVVNIVWTLPDFSYGDDRYSRAVIDAARMISLPALIAAENVLVDTDEMADQVTSDLDTAVYQRMNGQQFLYPLPPYTDPVSVPIAVTRAPIGVGLQVRCPRNWTRPWGLE